MTLIKEAYTAFINKKVVLKPSERKLFTKTISDLEMKVEQLKRTDYYIKKILPEKKSSENNSEDSA